MSARNHDRKVRAGESVAAIELEALSGERVPVPDPDRLVHLQFRRFAGCPVCNLHLRSMAARHEELVAGGIKEVVMFHAVTEALRANGAHELPFAVIPDPEKRLYRQFGVESSWRSVADPRAWGAEVRGALTRLRNLKKMDLRGGPLGLPADLLIAPSGSVIASHYGTHADDQWSVDDVLALARDHRP